MMDYEEEYMSALVEYYYDVSLQQTKLEVLWHVACDVAWFVHLHLHCAKKRSTLGPHCAIFYHATAIPTQYNHNHRNPHSPANRPTYIVPSPPLLLLLQHQRHAAGASTSLAVSS